MQPHHRSLSLRAALALFGLLAASFAAGCASPQSAKAIADKGGTDSKKFQAAEKTTVVGTMGWVSFIDAMGTVKLNRAPFPPGKILVARNHDLKVTAILETTPTNYGVHQGVLLVNGEPQEGDEVVEPGPDLAPLVDFNLGRNRQREAATEMDAAGTAAPEVVPGF